jgi:hypothetical protein
VLEKIFSKFSYKAQSTHFGFRVQSNILFFLHDAKDPQNLYYEILNFLFSKGFRIRKSDIYKVQVTEGFNFAGWHFKVKEKNYKSIHYPSRRNQTNFFCKIKSIMKDLRYKIEDRLSRVKTVYKWWLNKTFLTDLSQISFWSIKVWIYKYIRKRSKIHHKLALRYIKEIFSWEAF